MTQEITKKTMTTEVEKAAKEAAAAPDNAKAKAFANELRSLIIPTFKQSKAFYLLPRKVESLAKWIEAQVPPMN